MYCKLGYDKSWAGRRERQQWQEGIRGISLHHHPLLTVGGYGEASAWPCGVSKMMAGDSVSHISRHPQKNATHAYTSSRISGKELRMNVGRAVRSVASS